MYYVELEIVDDDGCRYWIYYTIKVYPVSGKHLSVWMNQMEDIEGADVGRIYAQILLVDGSNVDTLFDKDMAGWQNWTHLIFDATDSLDAWACDSVDVVLRWYCKTTDTDLTDTQLFWDDVWLFGGTVVNWNFEDGYPRFDTTWSGTHQRTDGNWVPGENSQVPGTYYCWEDDHMVHSGTNSGNCAQINWDQTVTAGDWGEFRQTVDVLGQ